MTIFKAYDVRGLYGEQIDGDVAYEVGRAFARVLGTSEPRSAWGATCGSRRRSWRPAIARG